MCVKSKGWNTRNRKKGKYFHPAVILNCDLNQFLKTYLITPDILGNLALTRYLVSCLGGTILSQWKDEALTFRSVYWGVWMTGCLGRTMKEVVRSKARTGHGLTDNGLSRLIARGDSFCVAWLSWDLLCRPGWPLIQRSRRCLCFLSAGTKVCATTTWHVILSYLVPM